MPRFQKEHKALYLLHVFLTMLIYTQSLKAETKTTSRPCPYNCNSLGLNSSNCKDYREGNTCFVEKISSGTSKSQGSRICLQASSGRLRVRSKCISNQGETEVDFESLKGEPGAAGQAGATGGSGANGTDGTLRVYGDGTAGDQVITSNTLFNFDNPQFDDFTVMSGATLTVPSGTVIRCTGSFFNQGTIVILSALRSHPKVSESGQVGDELESGGDEADGGIGGNALPEGAARQILRPGLLGGGDGYKRDSEAGSSGGGNLTIICSGGISNLSGGIIRANGEDGGELSRGGGGGGIIILASKTSVVNQGTISAQGGAGSAVLPDGGNNTGYGPGGGGGGGIVHLIAPTVSNSGTFSVNGGNGGPAAAAGSSITEIFYLGGGGGGGSGGDGGDGAIVNPGNIGDDSTTAGQNGTSGKTFLTNADPTSLY